MVYHWSCPFLEAFVCLFVCLQEVFWSRFVGRIKKNPDRHQRRTYPGTERSCFDPWLGDISSKAQPSSHSKLLRPRLVVIIAWAPPDQALPCCSAFIIVVSRLGANSGEPPLLSTVLVNSLYCNKIPSSGVCDIYSDIFFFKYDFLYRAFTSIPSSATYPGYSHNAYHSTAVRDRLPLIYNNTTQDHILSLNRSSINYFNIFVSFTTPEPRFGRC